MASTHASGELIFNREFRNYERRGAQRGWTKLRRGLKVQSGWAIITGPSQDNLATSIIIANSVVITTRPSQENIVTWITIANSLLIITSFTGKQLSLAFSDWYKTWHVSRVRPLCLQTGHTQQVWPSFSLPLPHFYYVFVIRHFAFFLVPSPLQELSNNNSLLRYFILALINKSAIQLLGQN